MKKILLAAISILPMLTYGQSIKIASKQIKSGLNGQVIVTRNGVNVLDSLKWADISNKPATPTLQQVTTSGATTNIPITIDVGNVATPNPILSLGQNGGSILFSNGTSSSGNFLPRIVGFTAGASPLSSFYFVGQGSDSYTKGFLFSQRNTAGTGQVTGGNLFTIQNYTTDKLSLDYNGALTLANLAGGGTTMVVANNSGTLSTQPLITNNNQLTNGAGYITGETDPFYTADKSKIMMFDGVIANNDDLNNYTSTGFWSASSSTTVTNRPSGTNFNFILEVQVGTGYTAQTYHAYNNKLFIRYYQSALGTWTSWTQVANIDDIPTVNDATLTLAASGIATGSQTFTANSNTNKTFTVNVPGTNLGGDYNASTGQLSVTSSTGTSANITLPALSSGVYNPTIIDTINLLNQPVAALPLIYSQVGNVVTVSGTISNIQLRTAGTTSGLIISLPISTTESQSTGTMNPNKYLTNYSGIVQGGTGSEARLTFSTTDNTTSFDIYFTCQYRIQ